MSEPLAYLHDSGLITRENNDHNAGARTGLYRHPDPRVAELEYRLHKQAEVHAYEKEALKHQVKMLSDPIVRQKMLEPAPPLYVEADKFVDHRVAELEAVLRECREVFADHCAAYLGHESNVKEAIAKIDEVLHGKE